VLGTLQQTCELAQQHRVTEVLIAAEELTGKQVRELIEDSQRHNISVKVLPSYQQLLHGKVDLRPRTVSIEDLLRREPVSLDIHGLHHWIDNRVLLVTGSAGSIGSEICRQLLQFRPRRLVLVDRSENGQFFLERELKSMAPVCELTVSLADVGDTARMENLIATYRPDIVFHAAAYKHVPLMEHNPGEALKNIVLTSKDLADLAHRYEVTSFVMISTDKAVNPTSVMGACKRVAELYVQSLAAISRCRFVTVRFGNVLDSAGSVVPIFRQQIASGGPVTVTHPDMTRFFMMIPEASQLVVQAGAMGQGGEIFVLDMGEPVRIVDLAADMIRLSGLKVGDDVEIEFVGVRPGEKLYEELHVAEEKRSKTTHPKIMVAESEARGINAISLQLERLRSMTESPPSDVVFELQGVVPEFTPDYALHHAPLRRAA
jgi:FlaA1/EpsC-like NDP-sugar epimerase